MKNILTYTLEDLRDIIRESGEKPFRASQLWQWLHCKLAPSYDEMSNLSKNFRQSLSGVYAVRTLHELNHLVSEDELTEKWLYRCGESERDHVEVVLIREIRQKRRTLCVSCMSGCPIGCVFCATGQGGFERNFSCGEILEQIYRAENHCQKKDGRGLTNIVFMGMGEPLLNLEQVLRAVKTVTSEDGLNFSARHITISTAGVPSGILQLADQAPNVRLAVSLHAPEQKLREKIIPTAQKWKLPELLDALKQFSKCSSRHITIEYCLINNFNDSKTHARQLADLLKGIPCKVNLIPLNPTEGFDMVPPPPQRIRAFQESLARNGLSATLREEKGQDIDAACGQLRRRQLQKND